MIAFQRTLSRLVRSFVLQRGMRCFATTNRSPLIQAMSVRTHESSAT